MRNDQAWEERVRARAHEIWEAEGRPEGGADRHWAAAEDELGATGSDPAAAAAGTETWTDPGGSVGSEMQESADPGEPGAPPDQEAGQPWWRRDTDGHRPEHDQTNMAPDNLRSNEL